MVSRDIPRDVAATVQLLEGGDYIADRALATVLFLALALRRPLLFEGQAGVGKTEVAKVLARVLGRRLLRLQCFDGLDLAAAAYEWDYPAQMLAIRLAEAEGSVDSVAANLYSRKYLLARPLLQALEEQPGGPPVLLIDEIDRSDEPFEAFLLEFLSDYQLSVPEFGTIRAPEPPLVIITSNRTREVHDALRRRCLYHWMDYPDVETEARILALKAPGVDSILQRQIVDFVQRLRTTTLYKSPGVAETIDWAHALSQLSVTSLDAEVIDRTLGSLLKYQDDIEKTKGTETSRLLAESESAA